MTSLSKTSLALLLFFFLTACRSEHTSHPSSSHWPEWQYKNDLPPEEFSNCYYRLKYKVSDLPLLIARLDDNSQAKHPRRYYFSGTKTVADEALWSITDLIEDLPFISFLDESYRKKYEDIGVGAYYAFVDADPGNRKKFKERVLLWIQSAGKKQKDKWGQIKWLPQPGY